MIMNAIWSWAKARYLCLVVLVSGERHLIGLILKESEVARDLCRLAEDGMPEAMSIKKGEYGWSPALDAVVSRKLNAP